MTTLSRPLRSALVVLVVALALSGCFRVEMSADIHSTDTISGEFVMAVSSQVLGMGGATIDDIVPDDTMGDLDVVVTPYDEAGLVGKRFTFTDQPIEEFGGDGIRVFHTQHGTYRFELDATEASDEEKPSGGVVKFSVTFPGEVVDTNGMITTGTNTVTWSGDAMPVESLYAEGKDGKNFLTPLMALPVAVWFAAGGVLTLLVLGAVVLMVRRRRATRHVPTYGYPVAPPPPSFGGPPPPPPPPSFGGPPPPQNWAP